CCPLPFCPLHSRQGTRLSRGIPVEVVRKRPRIPPHPSPLFMRSPPVSKVGGIALLVLAAPALARGASTCSSHIALSPDDRFCWVATPDNNSVAVIGVGGDRNVKVAEIPVGAEPQCVAITPNGAKVYVTNMVSGTVSVINALTGQVTRVILVGTEPFGC